MKKTIFTLSIMAISIMGIAQVPTAGLIAHYPFNGNANDASGNNINGTVYGAVLTTDRFNNQNSAYFFDGVNDYIECPNNSFEMFGSQQPSTFSFWFTLSERSKIISFFSKGLHSGSSGGNRYVAIEYHGSLSRFAVSIYDGGTQHNALATIDTNQIVINQWYHLTVIRNNSISIYLNGQYLTSTNIDAGWTTNYNSIIQNLPARWGVRNYTNPTAVSDVHHGKLDDIRVYNRALNISEITQLYNDAPCTAPQPHANDIALCGGGITSLTAMGGTNYIWYNSGGTQIASGATYTTPFLTTATTYYVSNYNGTCESTKDTVVITVNPLPIVSITPISVLVNIKSSALTLSGSPSGGTFLGSGVSGTSFFPKSAGLGTKIIGYTYTDNKGCSKTATTTTVIYDTTVCYVSVHDTLIINAVLTGVNPPNNINTIKVYQTPPIQVLPLIMATYPVWQTIPSRL